MKYKLNKILISICRVIIKIKGKISLTNITATLFIMNCLIGIENIFAISLESQLDTINHLTTGKIKMYGVSGATIAGGIWSLVRGNIKLTGVIVLIGIVLGFYLDWIQGGMKI